MRALVVYESMFGNTAAVARAVADGISSTMQVELVPVDAAPSHLPDDVALLVVGGPTHAFGLSRRSTRRSAADRVSPTVTSEGVGLREWIDHLHIGRRGVPTATFDTRMRRPRMPGSAARRAATRLRRGHVRLVAPPETFWVDGATGPLVDGQVDRARLWGVRLGWIATGPGRHPSSMEHWPLAG